ncbi:MAG: response regulator transcription factor [Flavobacteriales bacterium]|nr:Oxygen regulatory protein NreC [Flavobacteriales bacterium]MCC6577110.1 response regulator transcription factor [Flavobacteriales bacterium]NUQ15579.1 response regulator transcription factor [Flavobacteriales bacterium]
MPKDSPSILIADDHIIVRRGFKNLMALRMPHVKVEGVADAAGLRERLARGPRPDLLVLDLQLPDGNGMDLLPKLCGDPSQPPVLVYSMNPVRIHGVKAMRMGAMGYVSKEASEDDVVEAVRCVLSGNTYQNPELPVRRSRSGAVQGAEHDPMERLSARELMVLDLLLTGMGVKEVAEQLGLGVSTVGTYKNRIYEKLGVNNILDLQTAVQLHRKGVH